jgi:hypothetical protein
MVGMFPLHRGDAQRNRHPASYGAPMADGRAYELVRFQTRDGDETTVYLVRHPLARTRVRLACFVPPERLDHWCVATGHEEAMVAGFFVRDPYRPLGGGPHRRRTRTPRAGGGAVAVGAGVRPRGRRGLGDARAPRASAQPPVLERRPAGARIAARGCRPPSSGSGDAAGSWRA